MQKTLLVLAYGLVAARWRVFSDEGGRAASCIFLRAAPSDCFDHRSKVLTELA